MTFLPWQRLGTGRECQGHAEDSTCGVEGASGAGTPRSHGTLILPFSSFSWGSRVRDGPFGKYNELYQ